MFSRLMTDAKSRGNLPMHQALHLKHVQDLLATENTLARMVLRGSIHHALAAVSVLLLFRASRAALQKSHVFEARLGSHAQFGHRHVVPSGG